MAKPFVLKVAPPVAPAARVVTRTAQRPAETKPAPVAAAPATPAEPTPTPAPVAAKPSKAERLAALRAKKAALMAEAESTSAAPSEAPAPMSPVAADEGAAARATVPTPTVEAPVAPEAPVMLPPEVPRESRGRGGQKYASALAANFLSELEIAAQDYKRIMRQQNPEMSQKELDERVNSQRQAWMVLDKDARTSRYMQRIAEAQEDTTLASGLRALAFPTPRMVPLPTAVSEDPDTQWRRTSEFGARAEKVKPGVPFEQFAAGLPEETAATTAEFIGSVASWKGINDGVNALTSATGLKRARAFISEKTGFTSPEEAQAVRDTVQSGQRNPALDQIKKLKGAGRDDEARYTFDSLSLNQLPAIMQPKAPDVAAFRKKFAEDPAHFYFEQNGLEEVGAALNPANARDDEYVEGVLRRTPQNLLRTVQADVGLGVEKLDATLKGYDAAREATGGTAGETLGALLQTATSTDINTDRGVYMAPSAVGHMLNVAGLAPEVLFESEVPLAAVAGLLLPGGALTKLAVSAVGVAAQKGVGAAVGAAGDEETGRKISGALVPNKAGLDFMMSRRILDPETLGMPNYNPLRTERSTTAGRVFANLMQPEYQGFGALQTLQRGGVEQGALTELAFALDLGVDFAFDAEGAIADVGLAVPRAASTSYALTRTLPEGYRLQGLAATAAPRTYSRARATRTALEEGRSLRAALKEGGQAAKDADVLTAIHSVARDAVLDHLQGGKNPLARPKPGSGKKPFLPEPVLDEVENVMRAAGIDVDEARKGGAVLADAFANTMMDNIDTAVRREAVSNRGKRLLDDLRNTPEYRRHSVALDELVRRKDMTRKEADAALSFIESWAHTQSSNYATTGFTSAQQALATFEIRTRAGGTPPVAPATPAVPPATPPVAAATPATPAAPPVAAVVTPPVAPATPPVAPATPPVAAVVTPPVAAVVPPAVVTPPAATVTPATPPVAAVAVLPPDLAGAKPRYNIGVDSYEPVFDNDIDKALFIVAQPTQSRRHGDYMAFLRNATGLSDAEIISQGQRVREFLKGTLRGRSPGAVGVPAVYGVTPPAAAVTPPAAAVTPPVAAVTPPVAAATPPVAGPLRAAAATPPVAGPLRAAVLRSFAPGEFKIVTTPDGRVYVGKIVNDRLGLAEYFQFTPSEDALYDLYIERQAAVDFMPSADFAPKIPKGSSIVDLDVEKLAAAADRLDAASAPEVVAPPVVDPKAALRQLADVAEEAAQKTLGNSPLMPSTTLADGTFSGKTLELDAEGNVLVRRVADSVDNLTKAGQRKATLQELVDQNLIHGAGDSDAVSTSADAAFTALYAPATGSGRVVGTFRIPLSDLTEMVRRGEATLGNVGEAEITFSGQSLERYLDNVDGMSVSAAREAEAARGAAEGIFLPELAPEALAPVVEAIAPTNRVELPENIASLVDDGDFEAFNYTTPEGRAKSALPSDDLVLGATKDGTWQVLRRTEDGLLEAVSTTHADPLDAVAEALDALSPAGPDDVGPTRMGPVLRNMPREAVEQAILGQDIEYGVVFSADGQQRLRVTSGKRGSIEIDMAAFQLASVNGGTFTHNHPPPRPGTINPALSPEDITSCAWAGMAEVRVTTATGIHTLLAPNGWGALREADAFRKFSNTVAKMNKGATEAALPSYFEAIDNGGTSEQATAAWLNRYTNHFNEALARDASTRDLGLRLEVQPHNADALSGRGVRGEAPAVEAAPGLADVVGATALFQKVVPPPKLPSHLVEKRPRLSVGRDANKRYVNLKFASGVDKALYLAGGAPGEARVAAMTWLESVGFTPDEINTLAAQVVAEARRLAAGATGTMAEVGDIGWPAKSGAPAPATVTARASIYMVPAPVDYSGLPGDVYAALRRAVNKLPDSILPSGGATPDEALIATVLADAGLGSKVSLLELRNILNADAFAGFASINKQDVLDALDARGRAVKETVADLNASPFAGAFDRKTLSFFGENPTVPDAQVTFSLVQDSDGLVILLVDEAAFARADVSPTPIMAEVVRWAANNSADIVGVVRTGDPTDAAVEAALGYSVQNPLRTGTFDGLPTAYVDMPSTLLDNHLARNGSVLLSSGAVPPAAAATPPTGAATPPIAAATPPASAVPPVAAATPPVGGVVPPAGGAVPPAGGVVPPAGVAVHIIDMVTDGSFAAFVRGNAEMMRALGGDLWTNDFLRHFSHNVDPATGRVILTAAGEAQFESLLRQYLTSKVTSPTFSSKLNKLYTILQGLYLRARGINADPRLATLQLDALLRPDLVVQPPLFRLMKQAINSPRTLTVPESAAAQIGENVRRKVGQAAENVRTKTSKIEASVALGITKGDTTIRVDDAIASAFAQVITENARRQTAGLRSMRLVRMTTRTIVPEERLPVIRQRVREKLGLAGIKPTEIAKQVNTRTGVISFTSAQQPYIMTLVQQAKGTWFGSMLPEELTNNWFDGSRMSVEAYNRLVESITDSVAGPGSMRDRRAEAVPKSLGYAVQKVLVDTVTSEGFFAEMKQKLLKNFHIEFDGANHVDPGIVEIVERLKRELAQVNIWMREAAQEAKTAGAKSFPDFVKDMAGRLIPPMETHALYDNVDPITGQVDKYGLVGLHKLLLDDGIRTSGIKADDFLARVEDIEDVFSAFTPDGRSITSDMEFVALAESRRIRNEIAAGTYTSANMPDAEKVILADAQGVLSDGIRRRAQVVTDRSKDIALALAGGQDSGIMTLFSRLEEHVDFYASFYEGRWDDLFAMGAKAGLTVALENFGEFNKKYSQSEALLAMIGRLRAQELLTQFSQRLAMYGITGSASALTADMPLGRMEGRVTHADKVLHYLNEIVNYGEMRQTSKAGKVYEPTAPVGGHDLAAFTQANELMQEWGFKFGKGMWVRHVLPDGTDMLMPEMIAENLNDALNRQSSLEGAFREIDKDRKPEQENVLDVPLTKRQEAALAAEKAKERKRMVAGAAVGAVAGSVIGAPVVGAVVGAAASKQLRQTLDWLIDKSPVSIALYKQGVTTGLFLPNIPYYLSNIFGGFLQAAMGIGTKQTVSMLVRNPRFVSAVVCELFGSSLFRFEAPPIVTTDGRIFTVREVGRLAEAEGLSGSYIQAETVRAIADDIRDMEPTFQNKVARPLRAWRNILTEFASAIDNTYRVAAFVDEVRLGKSAAEAAETARKIAFDYTALTDFEKNYMRDTVMFYSYMRRNIDLFWDTMLTNPGRVLAQFRTINYANEQLLGEDNDILGPSYLEGRMALYVRQAIAESYASGKVAVFAPQVPAMDPVNLITDMVNITDADAQRELVAKMTPWQQAPFIFALGIEPFSARELGTYDKIPMRLYEMDMLGTGGVLTRGGFGVRWQSNKDPSSNDSDESDGYMQATNAKVWWIWRNMLQFPGAGRSMQQLEQWDRVDSGAIEGIVRAAKTYRKAGGIEEVDAFFGVVGENLPESLTAGKTLPIMRDPNLQTIEEGDLVTARPGFTRMNEVMSLAGLPARRLDNEAVALDRAYREAGFELSGFRKDLRRAEQFPKKP